MPGIIIPPGYAQGVLEWVGASDPERMVSTIGLQLGEATDHNSIAQELYATFLAAFGLDLLANNYSLVAATVYVGQDGGPPAVGEYVSTNTGTDTLPSLPNNCALLIRKRTGAAGRRGRGRMYLPGGYLPETVVDARGYISGGRLTELRDAASDFLTALNTVGTPHIDAAVVLHAPGISATPDPTPITALTVEDQIGTIRKRMRP